MRLIIFMCLCMNGFYALSGNLRSANNAELQKSQDLINSLQLYLNQLKTLSSFFIQLSPDGHMSKGRFWLKRPGKLRLDYFPPTPLLLLANGKRIYQLDKRTGDWDGMSLEDTPASLILSDTINFKTNVKILNFQRTPRDLRLTLVKKSDPDAGSLTLIFQESPQTLTGWIVKDAQGDQTYIQLNQIRQNVKIPEHLFVLPR